MQRRKKVAKERNSFITVINECQVITFFVKSENELIILQGKKLFSREWINTAEKRDESCHNVRWKPICNTYKENMIVLTANNIQKIVI